MKPLKPILSSQIYFPGLISLVILPLLCIGYFWKNGWLDQKTMLNVAYFNDAINKRIAERSDKPQFHPNSFRKYTEFVLTGSEKQNDITIREIIEGSKKLEVNKDTVNGYIIKFTNRTKYADVVKTFDYCNRDSVGLIYGDKVYFYWAKPWVPSKNNILITEGDLMIRIPSSQSFFEKLNVDIKKDIDFLKPFWPCLIPLAGMMYFWRKSRIEPNPQRQKRSIIK